MAANLGKYLGKSVAGIPVGAWVAVVGGGLAIGWYFSKGTAKNSGGTSPDAQVPLTDPGVGSGGGQFVYDPPTNVTNPNTDAITDNNTWARRAINWLIAQGYDPGLSQSAVSKFINGTNRTLVEQTLINLALVQFGAPPDDVPLPEVPQTPPTHTIPETKPPTPVRAFNYYTIRAGDSVGSIAARFNTSWWNIYVANDKVGLRPDGSKGVMSGPWDTKPGTLLVIPATSAGLRKPPNTVGGPIRYYTAVNGDTVSSVAAKYHIHPANLFQANDIAGMRPDGSKGFLINPSQKIPAGKRLVVPYQ
jgi:LysM repeat protein